VKTSASKTKSVIFNVNAGKSNALDNHFSSSISCSRSQDLLNGDLEGTNAEILTSKSPGPVGNDTDTGLPNGSRVGNDTNTGLPNGSRKRQR
jgi:hypothetical protein